MNHHAVLRSTSSLRFRHKSPTAPPADEEMACPACDERFLFGFECPDCGALLVSESLIGFNPKALAWQRPPLWRRVLNALLVRLGRRAPGDELADLSRGWRQGRHLWDAFDDLLAD